MKDSIGPTTTDDAIHLGQLAWFGRGVVAMLPLWTGAIPFGIAYGVAARSAGVGPGEAQLMSLLVFSAAAQVSAVSPSASGAPIAVLVATAMVLNAQALLLGLAVRREVRLSWPQRLLLASLLTDGAFAVTAARGRLHLASLLGAGLSMFAAWNLGTFIGIVAGRALPDPGRLGLDFVVPLTFLAVLVPLVRSRGGALVAVTAGAGMLLLAGVIPTGLAVLVVAIGASAAGAWATSRAQATGALSTPLRQREVSK